MGEGQNKMKAEAETGSSESAALVTGKTGPEGPVDIGEAEQLRDFSVEEVGWSVPITGSETATERFYTGDDGDQEQSHNLEPLQAVGSEGPDDELHTRESCEDERSIYGLPRDNEGNILIQGLDGNPPTFRCGFEYGMSRDLGEGDYGICRLAVTTKDKMEICVKEIHIQTELEEACEEARIVANLNSHVNICQGYGAVYNKDSFRFRIFMEFMPGVTMEELMMNYCEHEKRFEEKEMRNWITQVMDGLFFLHQNGIAHNDIKADNILLDLEHKRVCLVDFGNSSKRCDECDTVTCNAYNQNLNCEECSTWHAGRIDDIRETAKLTFQLVFIPEERYMKRYMTMESATIISAVKARDSKLGEFVEACFKLSSSIDLLNILKSNENMVQRRQ